MNPSLTSRLLHRDFNSFKHKQSPASARRPQSSLKISRAPETSQTHRFLNSEDPRHRSHSSNAKYLETKTDPLRQLSQYSATNVQEPTLTTCESQCSMRDSVQSSTPFCTQIVQRQKAFSPDSKFGVISPVSRGRAPFKVFSFSHKNAISNDSAHTSASTPKQHRASKVSLAPSQFAQHCSSQIICPCEDKSECPHRSIDSLLKLLSSEIDEVGVYESILDQDLLYVQEAINKLCIVRSEEEISAQLSQKEKTNLELRKELLCTQERTNMVDLKEITKPHLEKQIDELERENQRLRGLVQERNQKQKKSKKNKGGYPKALRKENEYGEVYKDVDWERLFKEERFKNEVYKVELQKIKEQSLALVRMNAMLMKPVNKKEKKYSANNEHFSKI